jgi:hypothetical protein
MHKLVSLTCALVFAFNGAIASAQNNCADVLRSVYDTTNRSEQFNYSHSFYNFVCESTFASYQSARDSGASLGIELDVLPISIGGHDRTTQWSQYQHAVCKTIQSQTALSRDLVIAVRQINAQVIDAWKSCVQSNVPGLYFWAETDDKAGAAGTVTFRAKWVGTGGDASITVDRAIRVTPPQALDCHGDVFPARLDIAQRSITCERNIDQAVQVKLHTARKGDREARVSEKIKPIALPPPTVTTLCLPASGFYRMPVTAGEPIKIRSAVSGSCSAQGWSCDRWATSSGPDGVANYRVGAAIDSSSNIGTLLGGFSSTDASTIDDVANAVKAAGPRRIGGAFDGIAPIDGYFFLIFNDVPGTWGDNAGAVWVEITRQPTLATVSENGAPPPNY